ARKDADDAVKKAETLQTRLSDSKERLARFQDNEALEAISFTKFLNECQFSDEDDFLKSRLPVDIRKAIREEAKKLEQRKINLTEQQSDRQKRLETEKSKELSQRALPLLLAEERQMNEALSQENQNLGAALKALEKNQDNMLVFQEKSSQREKQAEQLQRWAQLNKLIGSAKGNKYRNFAQNLTFDLMIDLANDQLKKMNDRYLLVRNQDELLELKVIDKYQGGELRSAKNLSGGESFIVSLALALGLSSIASRKVRVDSLFLDEGFGTLDDETLQTALETLAELNQEGKLIGIISHVAALKERIPTQIQVIKRSGGISILKGPGVRKL
ncbi:MAG TPA: chromosome segregation protein SMC, partial [Candidatus Marinimicrobia bacterium]|nr:chromosome segregation protein SMC [Candidatus Neomarinimicrobiota bacterium]